MYEIYLQCTDDIHHKVLQAADYAELTTLLDDTIKERWQEIGAVGIAQAGRSLDAAEVAEVLADAAQRLPMEDYEGDGSVGTEIQAWLKQQGGAEQ